MFIQKLLKFLFFFLIVKPYIYIILGVNVSGVDNFPKISKGANIIVANHNSHIDTLLLMSLFSCHQILKIHPVAAADYFCNTKLKSFIFKTILGLIPIQRKIRRMKRDVAKDLPDKVENMAYCELTDEQRDFYLEVLDSTKEELFKGINEALRAGETIIIYPEGTRGDDSSIKNFKSGIAHIAQMNPDVPITPFYINGPDRILPRGAFLWVPFIADVYAAEPIKYDGTPTKVFTERIKHAVEQLKEEHKKKEDL